MKTKAIKIVSLEAENIKRVKAVLLEPSASGLTIIGGKNRQGKTSIIDGFAWTVGGEKFRPSEPNREGAVTPAKGVAKFSNGVIAERKGKNGALTVTDPSGVRSGQTLLNAFVEELALDLPKFLEASSKEKARTLLNIIGVGEKLFALDQEESKLYDQRTAIGRIAEQKKKAAAEMPYFEDVPEEPVSASELIKQQQDILIRNKENQLKRERVEQIAQDRIRALEEINLLAQQIADLEAKRDETIKHCDELQHELSIAQKTAEEIVDEATEEIERSISEIDETNRRVRTNLDRRRISDEADGYSAEYEELTEKIEGIRNERVSLLDGADLPLPGLSVEDGELTYNGYKWDNISGSEQLKIAVAIVRKLKPECGFVLLDKLEQMDMDTLTEFGAWLESEDLQAIATRVSTGDECSVIIEDGSIADSKVEMQSAQTSERA
jgi:hypothetical protein